MKKLFLFTMLSALVFGFNSCSGSDDSEPVINHEQQGTVSLKLNGVQKTFNTILVHQSQQNENGIPLTVTASPYYGAPEFAILDVIKGETGPGAMLFSYGKDSRGFDPEEGFATNVTLNSNNKLQGTFSGEIRWTNNDNGATETITVTEGSFDITYEDEE